jgi:hypothetical protein
MRRSCNLRAAENVGQRISTRYIALSLAARTRLQHCNFRFSSTAIRRSIEACVCRAEERAWSRPHMVAD